MTINRNDVESTGIDRLLRVKANGDGVIETFLPTCVECRLPLDVAYLTVARSDRYALGALVHWHCYNPDTIKGQP